MNDPSLNERKKQLRIQEWKGITTEIMKWGLILWLLFPLSRLTAGRYMLVRVLIGILLFIIFAGKTFYDTVIMSAIRQRRTSLKEDLVSFLGMILGAMLLVGLVLLMFAMLIATWQEQISQPQDPVY
ncbi:hypothetical protein HQ585_13380 [candidate division KSB1 bacterium]|nr:hypothetical protein [candidate division KSB1 bacterium]